MKKRTVPDFHMSINKFENKNGCNDGFYYVSPDKSRSDLANSESFTDGMISYGSSYKYAKENGILYGSCIKNTDGKTIYYTYDGTIVYLDKSAESYTLTCGNITVNKGNKFKIPEFTFEDEQKQLGRSIRYSAYDKDIATVDENGIITTKKTGYATFLVQSYHSDTDYMSSFFQIYVANKSRTANYNDLCYNYETKESIHTPVKSAAVAATTAKSGLTEGIKCSVCSKVIKKQKTTLAKGTGLKVTSCTTLSAALSWTKTAGAEYYKVEKYNTSKSKWETVKTVAKNKATVTDLKSGTAYKFRITPIDKSKTIFGKPSDSVTAATLCNTPTIKVAYNKSGTVKISMSKVTGAKKYVVYKSENNTKWTKAAETAKTTYIISKQTKGKTLYFKAYCLNTDGKKSKYSKTIKVLVK